MSKKTHIEDVILAKKTLIQKFFQGWHGLNMATSVKAAVIGFLALIAAAIIAGAANLLNTCFAHWLAKGSPGSPVITNVEKNAVGNNFVAMGDVNVSTFNGEQKIPEIQVKPVDVGESSFFTHIQLEIINYSKYVAKNVVVDIKFGNHEWKRELQKAEGKNSEWTIQSDIKDNEAKKILESTYNRPNIVELLPGKALKLFLGDENREFLNKANIFIVSSDGKSIPISPTETPMYRLSQGWLEDLNKSNQPIRVLIRTLWENEIGRKFDRVVYYDLICTKVGSGCSYTFVPVGKSVEDV